jgi:hypothetical protein
MNVLAMTLGQLASPLANPRPERISHGEVMAVNPFLNQRIKTGLIWRLVCLKNDQLAAAGYDRGTAFQGLVRQFAEDAFRLA